MSLISSLIERGGPAVIVIMALSVALYTRCFQVLLRLRHRHFQVPLGNEAFRSDWRARRQGDLRDDFRQHRMTIGAMIAAAPLLGLLGTVSGMVKTFDSLATAGGEKSMEGLASGISEVLVATESGLAVALPAMLLLYAAHWLTSRRLRELSATSVSSRGGQGA